MAVEGGEGIARARGLTAQPLGARLPPIVGRTAERETLIRWLSGSADELVTIVGPAGCGKTRLALAVAADLAAHFNGRVAFVDLAPLTDPDDVLAAIARSLGAPPGQDPLSTAELAASLGLAPTLILLDNAEHLLAAAADLADLLAAAPRLSLLVTSRSPLGLYGEREYPLDPLPVPLLTGDDFASTPPDLTTVLACPSVELFIQAARMVRPDFCLTEANAAAVAAICARLDGLPLAIELAAARVKFLSPAALLLRLTETATASLRELISASPNRPLRHRTLEGAIAWSYALLSPDEQRLFCALSIFVGGFDLETAEAFARELIGGTGTARAALPAIDREAAEPPPSALDSLASLVNQSLIRLVDEDAPGGGRFAMLTTIRNFAREQLAAAGDVDLVAGAHARCFLRLAEAAEPHGDCAATPQPRERIERNWENLRAALQWTITARHDPIAGLRLAGSLAWFWRHGRHLTEGRNWVRTAIEQAPDADDAAMGKAWLALGGIEFILDQLDPALASLDRAVALARAAGDPRLVATALNKTACVVSVMGDTARETALYAEAIALFQACGDARGTGAVLNGLGEAARGAGDFATARARYEESLATIGGAAPHLTAVVQHNLGYVAEAEHDIPAMAASFQQGLALTEEIGDEATRALCFAGLGAAARAAGDPAQAARLFGAFELLRERGGVRLDLADRAAYERNVALAQTALGETGYAAALAAGRRLSSDQALEEARRVDGRAAAQPPARRRQGASTLTRRESEVALLVARGLTNRQIAEELTIAERTAGTHIEHIMAKLGCHSRAQVAAWVADQRPRPVAGPLRVA